MYKVIMESDQQSLTQSGEKLKAEAAVLETQIARLEQKDADTPALLRILARWCHLGDSKNIAWLRFKLKLKYQELEGNDGMPLEMRANSGPRFATARAAQQTRPSDIRETARQKMGRMINENPAALAQHIRRVYEPLVEVEESVEIKA